MKLVSIIVPIYSVEKYLDRCIQSLINQTLKDIEIILINDGSPDHSLEICKKYADKDSRIIVINKVNEGVSIARNKGIERSTGQYITFVDPDDWVEIDMYEKIYNEIVKSKSDICKCNHFNHNDSKISISNLNGLQGKVNKETITRDIIKNSILPVGVGNNRSGAFRNIWTNLYKRELIMENNIRFNKELPVGQDLAFNIKAYYYADSIYLVQSPYYHYQIGKGVTKRYKKNCWSSYKRLANDISCFLSDKGLGDSFKEELDILLANYSVISVLNEYKNRRVDRQELFNIVNDKELNECIEKVNIISATKSIFLQLIMAFIKVKGLGFLTLCGYLYKLRNRYLHICTDISRNN